MKGIRLRFTWALFRQWLLPNDFLLKMKMLSRYRTLWPWLNTAVSTFRLRETDPLLFQSKRLNDSYISPLCPSLETIWDGPHTVILATPTGIKVSQNRAWVHHPQIHSLSPKEKWTQYKDDLCTHCNILMNFDVKNFKTILCFDFSGFLLRTCNASDSWFCFPHLTSHVLGKDFLSSLYLTAL